ncbi:MAG: SagB/ThcOx family dehydrogenase [Bacteroidales bacterium]|nr:MAG: SagB/ThcOx family dehydrogenase [Bacteroidales bacterium]
MKKIILFSMALVLFAGFARAQELKPVKLDAPDKERGVALMKAFSQRASVREWSDQKLSIRDLSDLLWAANGVNRPDEAKRTAPSAMNAQDIDIYVFTEEGVYLYDAFNQVLNPVCSGDHRALPGMTAAPVNLVLISDISRFRMGEDSLKLTWAAMDAGIVSQNISVFCAGTELVTRPRASFPGMDKMKETLNLKDSQHVMLNHPVGYPKE